MIAAKRINKIMSLLLAIIFISTTTGYPQDLKTTNTLRVPLSSAQRLEEAINKEKLASNAGIETQQQALNIVKYFEDLPDGWKVKILVDIKLNNAATGFTYRGITSSPLKSYDGFKKARDGSSFINYTLSYEAGSGVDINLLIEDIEQRIFENNLYGKQDWNRDHAGNLRNIAFKNEKLPVRGAAGEKISSNASIDAGKNIERDLNIKRGYELIDDLLYLSEIESRDGIYGSHQRHINIFTKMEELNELRFALYYAPNSSDLVDKLLSLYMGFSNSYDQDYFSVLSRVCLIPTLKYLSNEFKRNKISIRIDKKYVKLLESLKTIEDEYVNEYSPDISREDYRVTGQNLLDVAGFGNVSGEKLASNAGIKTSSRGSAEGYIDAATHKKLNEWIKEHIDIKYRNEDLEKKLGVYRSMSVYVIPGMFKNTGVIGHYGIRNQSIYIDKMAYDRLGDQLAKHEIEELIYLMKYGVNLFTITMINFPRGADLIDWLHRTNRAISEEEMSKVLGKLVNWLDKEGPEKEVKAVLLNAHSSSLEIKDKAFLRYASYIRENTLPLWWRVENIRASIAAPLAALSSREDIEEGPITVVISKDDIRIDEYEGKTQHRAHASYKLYNGERESLVLKASEDFFNAISKANVLRKESEGSTAAYRTYTSYYSITIDKGTGLDEIEDILLNAAGISRKSKTSYTASRFVRGSAGKTLASNQILGALDPNAAVEAMNRVLKNYNPTNTYTVRSVYAGMGATYHYTTLGFKVEITPSKNRDLEGRKSAIDKSQEYGPHPLRTYGSQFITILISNKVKDPKEILEMVSGHLENIVISSESVDRIIGKLSKAVNKANSQIVPNKKLAGNAKPSITMGGVTPYNPQELRKILLHDSNLNVYRFAASLTADNNPAEVKKLIDKVLKKLSPAIKTEAYSIVESMKEELNSAGEKLASNQNIELTPEAKAYKIERLYTEASNAEGQGLWIFAYRRLSELEKLAPEDNSIYQRKLTAYENALEEISPLGKIALERGLIVLYDGIDQDIVKNFKDMQKTDGMSKATSNGSLIERAIKLKHFDEMIKTLAGQEASIEDIYNKTVAETLIRSGVETMVDADLSGEPAGVSIEIESHLDDPVVMTSRAIELANIVGGTDMRHVTINKIPAIGKVGEDKIFEGPGIDTIEEIVYNGLYPNVTLVMCSRAQIKAIAGAIARGLNRRVEKLRKEGASEEDIIKELQGFKSYISYFLSRVSGKLVDNKNIARKISQAETKEEKLALAYRFMDLACAFFVDANELFINELRKNGFGELEKLGCPLTVELDASTGEKELKTNSLVIKALTEGEGAIAIEELSRHLLIEGYKNNYRNWGYYVYRLGRAGTADTIPIDLYNALKAGKGNEQLKAMTLEEASEAIIYAEKEFGLDEGAWENMAAGLITGGVNSFIKAEQTVRLEIAKILTSVAIENKKYNYAIGELDKLYKQLVRLNKKGAIDDSLQKEVGGLRAKIIKSKIANLASDKNADKLLNYVKSQMQSPLEEMKGLLSRYLSDMKKGLRGEESSLQMIPAHVAPPTGLEKGRFYFLDVGGSNLRVGGVNLMGDGKYEMVGKIKEGHFSDQQKSVTAVAADLFGYIAENIADYLEVNNINNEENIILGFTWSFPVEQTGVDSGIHKFWTKGWQTKGVVGQDPVKLLRQAITANSRLQGRKIVVQAICNDTVGTFAAGKYVDPDCGEGVILGTGTNASHPEQIANIQRWSGKVSFSEMCINQEWGAFDKVLLTDWDKLLDAESDNQGKQILEKTFSGMYLGEIARLILKDLIAREMLFGGRSSRAFDEKYHNENNLTGFQASYMSRILADNSMDLEDVNALLAGLGIADSTTEDRKLLRDVSMMVTKRGARIAATVMLATVMKNDPNLENPHSIAIDGSLFEKFPFFKASMEEALVDLAGDKASKIKMFLIKDGSGVGAAILAAVAYNTAKISDLKRITDEVGSAL
ncbi:MAG: transaldolase family protein [Candidatus Omnitrophota bacterium]|jgi:hexokinase